MAKIAGTESTAKIRSAISTMMSAKNTGVAHHTTGDAGESSRGARTKNRLPWISGVTRKRLRRKPISGLDARSGFLSTIQSIFTPVSSKKAPNSHMTQSKRVISAAPKPIMMARITITPRMPQNSTRYWYAGGIAK